MVNKEKRYRQIQRAQGVILGASIVQGLVALYSAVVVGSQGQVAAYVIAFAYLALAVFFGVFKHPAFGLIYTVLYAADKLVYLSFSLLLLRIPGGELIGVSMILGLVLAAGLLAFFIYADYQAFVLRGWEKSMET